jgi:crotonobetainyl-CoA:carnitine CoA-transferase CaiB-like acyl-CoA transferase
MGPLADLRVIEMCDDLGQYTGKLLADMGADVVKVEPPTGSAARATGPFAGDQPDPDRSLSFWYYNTNKRSVVLDLADARDRESLRRLVATAGIVIEAHPPGFLDRLGLGFEQLRVERPDLIMCAITPFGQSGPWAIYQSSDMVALALGGQMNMNGYDPDDAPEAPPIYPQSDHGYNTAAHFAAIGILAALLHRDRTGEGQYIDCAMHEALAGMTEVGMPYWLYRRQNVIRQTGRHASVARTERWVYRARDGRDVLIFGVGRDNTSWGKIKRWFQEHGLGAQFDEPRFDSPQARQPGRGSPEATEIMRAVADFIAANDAESVYRGGQERDQAWGVVRSPEETLDDLHWWDRGFFERLPTASHGADRAVMPGAPYRFSVSPWALRRPAPKLGEHTREIMDELAGTSLSIRAQ